MCDYHTIKTLGIIKVDHPPVNSLSTAVCQDLYKFVRAAIIDSKVQAIIICGNGATFISGGDISEFGKAQLSNWLTLLSEVVDLVEKCEKPVISAIHGYAFGGGLEVALASHYRVALSSAKFGFPEVDLGILPGAGGTQRFPRLVGLQNAAEWITTGKHYTAQEAADIGVIDKVFPASSNILNCAIEYSCSIIGKSLFNRRVSSMPVKDAAKLDDVVLMYKKKLDYKNRGAIAPHMCLQSTCNAVTLPFQEGMQKEREIFKVLVSSGQSKALRNAFFAERFVAKWKTSCGVNYKNSIAMPVNKTAVIGLGTMGSGIAISLATLGRPVLVLESSDEMLLKAVQNVRGMIDRMKKRREISEERCASMQKSIVPCNDYDQLKDVDLVIEAVFESLELKKKLFYKLDNICKPSAVLASNTSFMDIDAIASQTQRPDKVAGMHFCAPAHRMKLLENVKGAKTSSETIATIMNMGKKMNKCTVLVGNCPGFMLNRMYDHYITESDFLLEEGAYPAQIDSVLKQYGFRMGRYEVSDLSGSDIHHSIRAELGRTKAQTIAAGLRYNDLSEVMHEKRRFGLKTNGKGWYKFINGQFCVDDEVTELIEDYRTQHNIKPRKILPQEILERMLYSMINEGFKAIEDGIVSNPQSIDMAWIYGMAWPKYTGGPMYYAYSVGLPRVLKVIERYWKQFGDAVPYWEPSNMLVHLVKSHGNPLIGDWMSLSRDFIQCSL